MKQTLLICIIALLGLLPLSALTIDEAVSLALEHNLSLTRSRIEMDGKKRASDRSWNSLIPQINAGANVSRGTSLTGDISPGREEWTPGISLSASIGLSPSIISTIGQTKADYEAGGLSYKDAKQSLELEVRKYFYQILLLRSNVELEQQNISSAEERYKETAALAKVGQVSHLEELQAQVDRENLKPVLRSAQTQYENALDNFALVLGLPQLEQIAIVGSLEDALMPPAGEHKAIVSMLGVKESFSTLALKKSIESLQQQRKSLQYQTYIPNLVLSWNGNPAYTNDTWADTNGSFSVGLSMNLDALLPGSAARTKIDALNDSIRVAENQIQEASLNQQSRVRQYMRTIEQSIESVNALLLNIELAEQTYTMYVESYRHGTSDLQQLRSSADSLSQTKNRLYQEYYTLIAAALDLEKEINVPFGDLAKIEQTHN
ncbi:MAG: TolC family protein [Treponema sp.]|jgi:outer membrane protein TolC|nr:TolC family protein [Treponema sp.]